MMNREHDFHRRRNEARPVSDFYPDVSLITLNIVFTDPDGDSHPDPLTLTFRPGDRAFFERRCPFHECVDGGFGFGSAVRSVVQARLSSGEETFRCEGWQDQERIGRHLCALRADVDVRVEYSEVKE